MKSDFQEWLAVTSNVAILIGILVVIWELQRIRDLTHVQLMDDVAVLENELRSSLMGESPEIVLAKACLWHDELTAEDKIVLGHIFSSSLSFAALRRNIELESGLDTAYESSYMAAFQSIFNYEFGLEFFERMKESPYGRDNEIIAIGDELLARNRLSDCATGTVIRGGF